MVEALSKVEWLFGCLPQTPNGLSPLTRRPNCKPSLNTLLVVPKVFNDVHPLTCHRQPPGCSIYNKTFVLLLSEKWVCILCCKQPDRCLIPGPGWSMPTRMMRIFKMLFITPLRSLFINCFTAQATIVLPCQPDTHAISKSNP